MIKGGWESLIVGALKAIYATTRLLNYP